MSRHVPALAAAQQVPPETVMFDDWRDAIARAMPRIKLV